MLRSASRSSSFLQGIIDTAGLDANSESQKDNWPPLHAAAAVLVAVGVQPALQLRMRKHHACHANRRIQHVRFWLQATAFLGVPCPASKDMLLLPCGSRPRTMLASGRCQVHTAATVLTHRDQLADTSTPCRSHYMHTGAKPGGAPSPGSAGSSKDVVVTALQTLLHHHLDKSHRPESYHWQQERETPPCTAGAAACAIDTTAFNHKHASTPPATTTALEPAAHRNPPPSDPTRADPLETAAGP